MERHLNSPQTGKPLKRGNPVPSCGDKLQKGVETHAVSHRVAAAIKYGAVAGEVPALLNGELAAELANSSMAAGWDSPNLRASGEPFVRDTLVRTSGYFQGAVQDNTDLFTVAGKPAGETNLPNGSTLPSDQSFVVLALRVFCWFRHSVERPSDGAGTADTIALADGVTTILADNGDWILPAAAGSPAFGAALNGQAIGNALDQYRLHWQSEEQILWSFGAGDKYSLTSMPLEELAASKPTSNGEPLTKGDPVPSCSDELEQGVETCVEAQQMALEPKRGVHVGAEPTELNGGVVTELANSSMVTTWDSPIPAVKPEPKFMAAYFPYGGGLAGDNGGNTDLIHWQNGIASQDSILRLARAVGPEHGGAHGGHRELHGIKTHLKRGNLNEAISCRARQKCRVGRRDFCVGSADGAGAETRSGSRGSACTAKRWGHARVRQDAKGVTRNSPVPVAKPENGNCLIPPRQNIKCSAQIVGLPDGGNGQIFGSTQGTRNMLSCSDSLNACDLINKVVSFTFDGQPTVGNHQHAESQAA